MNLIIPTMDTRTFTGFDALMTNLDSFVRQIMTGQTIDLDVFEENLTFLSDLTLAMDVASNMHNMFDNQYNQMTEVLAHGSWTCNQMFVREVVKSISRGIIGTSRVSDMEESPNLQPMYCGIYRGVFQICTTILSLHNAKSNNKVTMFFMAHSILMAAIMKLTSKAPVSQYVSFGPALTKIAPPSPLTLPLVSTDIDTSIWLRFCGADSGMFRQPFPLGALSQVTFEDTDRYVISGYKLSCALNMAVTGYDYTKDFSILYDGNSIPFEIKELAQYMGGHEDQCLWADVIILPFNSSEYANEKAIFDSLLTLITQDNPELFHKKFLTAELISEECFNTLKDRIRNYEGK